MSEMLGVECPECGDLRTGVAKAGFDIDGHRIRGRRCKNCGHSFTTLEIPIPFVFNRVDTAKSEIAHRKYEEKTNRRVVARRQLERDHFEIDEHATNPDKYTTVSEFIVRLKRAGPKKCYAGKHWMVGKNVVNRPNGTNLCRECRKEWQRKYRRERMERFPIIAAEIRAANAIKSRAYRARKRAERQQEQQAVA